MKRRSLLAGIVLLAAAGAGAAWKFKPFRKHYPPTDYDDLLAHLDDREWAEKFGAAALAALPDFTPANGSARLHPLLKRDSLQTMALRDAEQNRLVEVNGWLVPEVVALLAALAKSVVP